LATVALIAYVTDPRVPPAEAAVLLSTVAVSFLRWRYFR
jgi:hypothetical protein